VLAKDGVFFSPRWCLFRVRVKDGRGEAEVSQRTLVSGDRRSTEGTFSPPSWDGVEGGAEAVLCVGTYVTEKHFVLVGGF